MASSLGRTEESTMKIFVYKPDTTDFVPFQIALRREGLSKAEVTRFLEQMCFRSTLPVAADWRSPPMCLRWDGFEEGGKAVACDFPIPDDSGAIVMSKRAKEALSDYLKPYGELLPLQCEEGQFWILNVTKVLDALDLAKSEWINVPGEPATLWREAFLLDQIDGVPLFRLPPSFKKSGTYFTQQFLDVVASHKLLGLAGRSVWSEGTTGS
jgi:hypothetical protein